MNQLLTAITPYIVPTIIILAGYTYHLVAVHIPAQQRAYIEAFTKSAVLMVEQQFSGKSDEEKKQLAMDAVKGFFKAFNLPCPPDDVLSAFIEAAVKALDTPTATVPLARGIDPGMAIDPFKKL